MMRRDTSYSMFLACAAVALVAAGPVRAQAPTHSPSAAVSYEAPPGAPYTAEHVLIRSPYGHTLGGTLTRPCRARGPLPAVVLISGTGPQDRDGGVPGERYRPLRQIADTLSRRGLAVLRFDDRGVTAGKYFSPASPLEVAEDVRAALMLLRARGDIDPARLALVGHSEGGLVATMVAASDPSLRAAVLLGAPAKMLTEGLREQIRIGVERDTAWKTTAERDSVLRVREAALETQLRQPWARQTASYDPLISARAVRTASVLVLQGATDWQVSPAQAAMLGKAFRDGGNRDVTVTLFPATNHLFLPDPDGNPDLYDLSKPISASVLGVLADWAAVRMGAPAVRAAGRPPGGTVLHNCA
ncbi:hypothetical protein BH20GEM3_BH20GEM3_15030 [soil metagenome]